MVPTVILLRPIYRIDISIRHQGGTRAGARRPRTAQGAAPPRLRAEEAPRRDPRIPLGGLVRIPVPGPQATRACRGHRDRRAAVPAIAAVPTGSLKGDLAAARSRSVAARVTGSRRTRKAYRITDQGDALFAELLLADDERADAERAFALKLAFCRHLPRPRGWRCSSVAGPRSRPVSMAPAAASGPRGPTIATPAASWSTEPAPPPVTSSGSRSSSPSSRATTPTTPCQKEPPHECAPQSQDRSCRDRRRRQLLQQPGAGRRVLPRRRPQRRGSRAHARRCSAATTWATSSSSRRSTSTRPRSGSISARRSPPVRTTR